MPRWNADANGDGYGYSHTDGNAYGYGDCHSNGYPDCYGYSDGNRSETDANAAAASNNTAAASVVRNGKWNSSCGNSRVTLASSPHDNL